MLTLFNSPLNKGLLAACKWSNSNLKFPFHPKHKEGVRQLLPCNGQGLEKSGWEESCATYKARCNLLWNWTLPWTLWSLALLVDWYISSFSTAKPCYPLVFVKHYLNTLPGTPSWPMTMHGRVYPQDCMLSLALLGPWLINDSGIFHFFIYVVVHLLIAYNHVSWEYTFNPINHLK